MKALLLGVLLIVVFAGTGIRYCPVPWAAVLLSVAALVACGAWGARRDRARLIMTYLAAVFVALVAFESYLGHQEKSGDGTTMEGTITEDFTRPDDLLGYAPKKASSVTARKLYGDKVLYDVVYDIGSNGLRVMPEASGARQTACVVFFGDSVTFGEGVNDDESFPYLVGRGGDGELTAYNFAFSGYGPHQMLALLQSEMVRSKAKCSPTHFIYLAIVEHIARVAGLVRWDRHGPRFRLDGSGTPVRDANFDGERRLFGRWTVPESIVLAVNEFRTWQRFFGRDRNPDDADLELFLGVVIESARLARTNYPGSEFHVILWDGREDARIAVIIQRLTAAGIRVERLTAAIPDFTVNASRYILSPHDGHPNALMHKRISDYILTKVIGPAPQ